MLLYVVGKVIKKQLICKKFEINIYYRFQMRAVLVNFGQNLWMNPILLYVVTKGIKIQVTCKKFEINIYYRFQMRAVLVNFGQNLWMNPILLYVVTKGIKIQVTCKKFEINIYYRFQIRATLVKNLGAAKNDVPYIGKNLINVKANCKYIGFQPKKESLKMVENCKSYSNLLFLIFSLSLNR